MAGSRLALVSLTALALIALPASASAAPRPKAPTAPPAAPIRLGFCSGDDWEPELAHQVLVVYAVTTHYPQPVSCGTPASA